MIPKLAPSLCALTRGRPVPLLRAALHCWTENMEDHLFVKWERVFDSRVAVTARETRQWGLWGRVLA